MIYLAILSLSEGRRAALAAVAGVALGLLIVGMGAAFGLAALIQQSEFIYQLLRWVGVFYLVWLGVEGFWRATYGDDGPEAGKSELGTLQQADGIYFRRGLVTNLLNPKAGLYFIAVVPGFVNPEYESSWQLVFLSLSFVVVATAIHLTIVLLAARARLFLESAHVQKRVRQGLSLLLVVVAVWFYFESSRVV
ncbi:MAG: threonine transporter RhtB [Rhodomicrobium sp.]|nr:MAG: threonine transporter RhtB [Rhodomicrobium sp.]